MIRKTDPRVITERARLAKAFDSMPIDIKKTSEKLIDNAAFMAVTLDDLMAIIRKNGCTDKYQNGENQFGVKKSAEVDVYNVMIKNFTSVMDKLLSLCSKKNGSEDDGFDDFINGRDD